jgi:putative ABC transport system substrate-binding protein
LIVGADVTLFRERELIVALAAHHHLPAIYYRQEFSKLGGLLSYGTDTQEAYRLAADYAAHILKGEKVGDLPVVQATKIKLVANLKTATSLGLELPTAILVRADEVIE